MRILQDLHIAGGFSHQLRDAIAHGFAELEGPLVEALLGRAGMRRHVDAALHRVIRGQHLQNCELGTDDLSGGCGGADQDVVVAGVQHAEGLGLNGIEDLQGQVWYKFLKVF